MEGKTPKYNQEIFNMERDYGEYSLTVEEVLSIPAFKDCKVIAGHKGLQKRCRHITILETPEGIEWLKGGEFLLSAGYAFKENTNLYKNTIFMMNKQSAPAFAIKEHRYLDKIPQEMIEQADYYDIPLIKVPYNLVYTEAVSGFYERLFFKKNKYLLQTKNIHERLLKLVFENKDMKGVIDVLSTLTSSSIIVYDSVFNLLSWNLYDNNHQEILDIIIKSNGEMKDVKHENCYISRYPIISNEKPTGYIYIISSTILDNLNMNTIDHGRMILSLKMTKEENESLNEIKIKKSITQLILNSENLPHEFYYNIRNNYNWIGKENFRGISIQIYNNQKNKENVSVFKNKLYGLISRILKDTGFLTAENQDIIFIFYCMDDIKNINDFINKIRVFTEDYKEKIKLSFGISGIYKKIQDVPQMYRECYIASLFNKEGETLYYDSLDTIKLIYSLKEDKQVLAIYKKTIQKLEEYDLKNRGELLNTLERYYQCDMNRKLTSDRLHIHIETLRYRLSKIESLTGYSLNTSEGNFILQMNLKLHKILKMQ